MRRNYSVVSAVIESEEDSAQEYISSLETIISDSVENIVYMGNNMENTSVVSIEHLFLET